MPDIRKLPPGVVNKIAAGEVIERPASVVKELLENAVDAGASRIDVSVARGGTELVRVTDNGCGIAAGQVALAVASHATNKIRSAEDLFQVRTLGFRGEALASIAEVSQLVLRTRTADAEAGVQLEVDGGRMHESRPCSCPVGATVEVRNLFYNTPVRRKFLRATQTEMGHVLEAFTRVALAQPATHLTLRHSDKLLHDLPAVENWRDRILAFFGDELAAGLIPVASREGQVRLSGYVADPGFSRSNNRMQYLFLNGRHIRDRSLQHALGEAYRGLMLAGRYPIAFLRLEMPPEMVDVNVHPAKLEVRFQDGGQLYSQLLGTLRSKFLTTDLTAKVQWAPAGSEERPAAADRPRAEHHHYRQPPGGPADQRPETPVGGEPDPRQDRLDLGFARPREMASTLPPTGGRPAERVPFAGGAGSDRLEGAAAPNRPTGAPEAQPARAVSALQVHNRYLVTEDDHGVLIIDQHALHERILYEQLREKVLAGQMETQRLLVPEPVCLTAAEAAAALEAKPLLAQLGIEVEPFGGDTVVVAAYPAMLANLGPAEMLRQIVERLLAGGKAPDRRDLLDDLLHLISCKAAVKAGDRLSPEEISALLQHRELCQDSHHCPHGRPAALVFTRQELDRRFKRT